MRMKSAPTTPPREERREIGQMENPEEVQVMLELHRRGLGIRKIAAQLGCSPNTVRRYIRLGGWQPYAGGERQKILEPHQAFLEQQLEQHHGNADVVRQELQRQHKIRVSLRTVQRAVRARRRQLRSGLVATVRYETPPGQQLQADFGELYIEISGVKTKVHLCVLTLSWCRRVFVRAYPNERIPNWLTTLEEAFAHFGGVPAEVLIDNARALVHVHDVETGEVQFSARFSAFAKYWCFKPRACAPYRPQTKGKDERGVQYVKRNAIAGRTFESWPTLDAWLIAWSREISDTRVHGTTGERPIDRFEAVERARLSGLRERAPFVAARELPRRVHKDACVEFEANWYTVPWRLVGSMVKVQRREHELVVRHEGIVVARHTIAEGRRVRVVDEAHWRGLTPTRPSPEPSAPPVATPEYARSLDVYAALVDEVAA